MEDLFDSPSHSLPSSLSPLSHLPLLGGQCLSPLLSAANTPLPQLEPSDLSILGAFNTVDDWKLELEPQNDFQWDIDSTGHSSLSSPSSLGDSQCYANVFPHSTCTSFAGSPVSSECDFSFDCLSSSFYTSTGTSTVSNPLDNCVKMEPLTPPSSGNCSPQKPSTTKPKRRPAVSSRTALLAAKANGGRLSGNGAKGNGRMSITNRGGTKAKVLTDKVGDPSSISLFSDENVKDEPIDVTSTFPPCTTDSIIDMKPLKNEMKMDGECPITSTLGESPTHSVGFPGIGMGTRKSQMLRPPSCHLVHSSSLPVVPYLKKPVLVRRRMRECTMVCWLFRTLLTAEYRALPLNGIFEVFEDTFNNPSSAHGRHWRQSIRHCLMSSAVFVRVLTPNPRKDFLVMNEAGSWWTVHPDTEALCAREVFAMGAGHRCPPQQGMPYRLRLTRTDDTRQLYEKRGSAFLGERIYRTPPPLAVRRIPPRLHAMRATDLLHFGEQHYSAASGDHLVIDHEEEVC